MNRLSVGLSMAWQIAAAAAASGRCHYIEKEHLFIGIFSLDKLIDLGEKKIGLSMHSWLALQHEHEILHDILSIYKADMPKLRRAINELLVKGTSQRTKGVLSRSEECKAVFQYAEQVAKVSGTDYLSCLHVLIAILRNPGALIEEVLKDAHILPLLFMQKVTSIATNKALYATQLDKKNLNTMNMFACSHKVTTLTLMFDELVASSMVVKNMNKQSFTNLLEHHRATVSGILKKENRGIIVKSVGNGLLMIFSSLKNALDCALEIQMAFEEFNAFKIRLGIDTGEFECASSVAAPDMGSLPLEKTYRIMRCAEGGHVLTSKDAFQRAKTIMQPEILWKLIGTCSTPQDGRLEIYEVFKPGALEPMSQLLSEKAESDYVVMKES